MKTSFDVHAWAQEHDLPLATNDTEPRFLWVDLETTGLDDARDVILECGMVLTNRWGEVIPEFSFNSLILERSDHYTARIDNMDTFVRQMHENSGLLHDLETQESVSINKAQERILDRLQFMNIRPKTLYIAGSTIKFDSGFLKHYAPELEKFLHHRDLNVSSLKILCQELNPELYDSLEAQSSPRKLHRSLSDLADSLQEFYGYVENFLFIPGDSEHTTRMPIQ